MRFRAVWPLLALLAASCAQPAPSPHYQVGAPYQAGGIWYYPHEDFSLDETGLAIVASTRGGLTADGEVYDETALAAGHPSLQLPAIARVTNLENGRQVVLRVNDRGPGQAGRAMTLTPKSAALLGVSSVTPARVRLQVLDGESRQVAQQMQGGTEAPAARPAPGQPAPLAVTAAPRAAVQAETLAPPSGAQQAANVRSAAPAPKPLGPALPAQQAVPQRMPETVVQTRPSPGQLAVECGRFSGRNAADMMRSRLAGLGAQVVQIGNSERNRAYAVRLSGLRDVAQADAMLARAQRAGVADPRIIVE